jgi:hypothetical protein
MKSVDCIGCYNAENNAWLGFLASIPSISRDQIRLPEGGEWVQSGFAIDLGRDATETGRWPGTVAVSVIHRRKPLKCIFRK